MIDLVNRAKAFFGIEPDPQKEAMAAIIEMVVQNFTPEVKRASNYRERLESSINTAAKHIVEVAENIPGPLDIMSKSARDHLLIKPFFLNREEFETAVHEDPDLNEFLRQNRSDVFYTVMTMESRIKTIFGSEMQGDVLVRDIALKAVDMSDYKFRVPSETMADLMQNIEIGTLQLLTRMALEAVLDQQSRNAELEKLQEELSVKIEFFTCQRRKMDIRPIDKDGSKICAEAQALLNQIENELETNELTPEYYLDHLCDVFDRTDQYISARLQTLRLDRMNNLIADKSRHLHNPIQVMNCQFDPDYTRSAILLKCDRNVILSND